MSAVLVTSAGRRTSLVEGFVRAARPRGWRVIAADVDGLAPALFAADEASRLPATLDESFVPALLELVSGRDVRLVVPTVDTELRVLSHLAPALAQRGCLAAVSSPDLVRISSDKLATVCELGSLGIRVPRSWAADEVRCGELPEDLFVKPRNGSASRDARPIARRDVRAAFEMMPDAVVQERITAPEITIDALLDLDGRPLHYVPRLRVKAVGGESVEGVTIADDDLRDWICGVLSAVGWLGGRGPITLQAFLTPGEPTLSEVNPRFGGGFPLALAAGADYPAWLVLLAEGLPVPARLGCYTRGLHMTRHYVERFVTCPLWT